MSEKQSLLQPEVEDLAVSVNVTPASPGFTTIACQICSAVISLEGKHSQHVVKCQQCGEATPIKSAPPGKKYVRCSCNCLLICKAGGRKVACPRDNCRRVIAMSAAGGGGAGAAASSSSATNYGAAAAVAAVQRPPPGQVQCLCGHCGSPFTVPEPEVTPLARCPHCGRKSSVGPHFVRRRWLAFLSAGLVFVTAAAICAIFTWRRATGGSGGYFVLYSALLLIGLIAMLRSCLYCRTKVSIVEARGIGV